MNHSKKHGACDSSDSSPVFCKVAKLDASVAESQDATTVGDDTEGSSPSIVGSEDSLATTVIEATGTMVECVICGQTPCDWITFGDELCEECDSLKDQNIPNKSIRHHAYRTYIRLKLGVLRRYDRRPLPMCVYSEIIDCYPDPNGNYVGFQAALKDAVLDE
jgi:hypothetical protein